MSAERRSSRTIPRVLKIGAVVLVVLAVVFGVARETLLSRIDPPGGFAQGDKTKPTLIARRDGGPHDPVRVQLRGQLVDAAGGAAAGMVTLRHLETGRRDTVYAVDGAFAFPALPKGSYEVSAHDGGDHKVLPRVLNLDDGATPLVLELTQPSTEPRPAAYYATKLKFPDERMRDDFRMQCHYCHTIGNSVTRRPRSQDEWLHWIGRMYAMGALIRTETMEALPSVLAEGLDGTYDHELPPPILPDRTLADTHIVEWPMGASGGYMHDLAIGEGGWIYAVDMNLDRIEAVNTQNAASRSWAIPAREHPRGGYLRGAAQPVGTTTSSQAPHSVEYGPDDRLWITHSLGSEIAAFDVASGVMQHWSLPRGSYYPHTLQVHDGQVWFTVTLSNQLGRLIVADDRLDVLSLPATGFSQRFAPSFLGLTFALASYWPGQDRHVDFNLLKLSLDSEHPLPAPYGIDQAPDGSFYFSQLYADRIGRYDPQTEELTHWTTPFVGPRRLAVAGDGRVFIPAFGSGLLAVFDPATASFRTFDLPSTPKGGDAPYAVNVHPDTGDVWVTSTTQDVLYRFDPRAEIFTVYPLPTRGAFMREIEFGSSGEVCTTYSNLPEHHMPDPSAKLMCLFPGA